ncbi:MAG: excinuclease subunit, partial [Mycobacterium sp.]|nr:excinuclease subunit [Mycobacterium sp.]
MADRLIVKGAREHNLRSVDLDLPREALIVFTGLSGSGKSSLAFDTIFAEGQRRYVESLSAYARQFLGQMDKPDVDFIEGLSPAVSIDQKSTNRNPRSTVGTITEVYDYLRLLYARAGTPHCPVCGERIARQTPQQIVDQVLAMPEGTRFQVLAPVVRTRKGEFADLFEKLNSQGYSRVRVDAVVRSLTDPPKLKKQEKHDIEVVVDRLTVKPSAKQRLTDSVETALQLADGIVVLEFVDHEHGHPHREQRFSEKLACPNGHPLAVDDLEPRSFSFNSPYGACPECAGLGIRKEVDPDLVVPDPDLTLAEGAVAPWSMGHTAEYFTRMMASLGEAMGFDVNTPWRKLPARARKAILEGSDEQVHVRYRNRYGRVRSYYADFEGVMAFLQRKMDQTESEQMKERYDGFMRDVPCPICHGTRLKPEILAVTLSADGYGAKSIAEVSNLSISEAAEFLNALTLGTREQAIAGQVLKEIQSRLGFLLDVGLEYLSLSRAAATLSGGEAQRIRLATQIGSGLVGVAYILDEPTAGLHPSDTARLIESLADLRDRGNSVIVVEHDEATIRAADWLVDLGPGAGPDGGLIVAQGTPARLIEAGESATARYLRGEIAPPPRPADRLTRSPGRLKVRGASE